MDINRNAPAIGAGEIQIAAPPEAVWGILSDIDGWPSWNAEVKSAHLEGPLAVGSRFRWKSGSASLSSNLQQVDPPKQIGWTGTTLSIKATHVFRLEPRDGGTFVQSEESFEGFVARLLKGFSRKTIDSAIRAFLAGLKREAEARTSS